MVWQEIVDNCGSDHDTYITYTLLLVWMARMRESNHNVGSTMRF